MPLRGKDPSKTRGGQTAIISKRYFGHQEVAKERLLRTPASGVAWLDAFGDLGVSLPE
jgi:hypothetical protein